MKRIRERANFRPLSPARMIAISFALVILSSTLLLMLPFASKPGQPPMTFLTSLFTATSATCVTGLTLIDPYTQLTIFGQIVLLLTVEIGGLGILTFTSFFMLAMGRRVALHDLRLAQENANAASLQHVRPLVRLIIATTVTIQSTGALLLCLSFVPRFGLKGIWISIFTAVSAYCNAGFDILGFETPFGSLTAYNNDPIVMYTVMALIFFGGLGFVVCQDLLNWRRHRHLMTQTKIVIVMSFLLIIVGAVSIFMVEYENPATMGRLSFGGKINAAMFQSVTSRTAGFASLDIAQMKDFSKVVMIFLMFIGAGSGSTGGGIKISTFTVLGMTVLSVIRGREDTVLLGRRIDKKTVYKSLSIAVLSIGLVVVTSGVVLTCVPDISGVDGIYEAVSAFGTVGVTAGVTLKLNTIAKLAIILTMFIGRVGPVSCALAFTIRANERKGAILPECRIMVG